MKNGKFLSAVLLSLSILTLSAPLYAEEIDISNSIIFFEDEVVEYPQETPTQSTTTTKPSTQSSTASTQPSSKVTIPTNALDTSTKTPKQVPYPTIAGKTKSDELRPTESPTLPDRIYKNIKVTKDKSGNNYHELDNITFTIPKAFINVDTLGEKDSSVAFRTENSALRLEYLQTEVKVPEANFLADLITSLQDQCYTAKNNLTVKCKEDKFGTKQYSDYVIRFYNKDGNIIDTEINVFFGAGVAHIFTVYHNNAEGSNKLSAGNLACLTDIQLQ